MYQIRLINTWYVALYVLEPVTCFSGSALLVQYVRARGSFRNTISFYDYSDSDAGYAVVPAKVEGGQLELSALQPGVGDSASSASEGINMGSGRSIVAS